MTRQPSSRFTALFVGGIVAAAVLTVELGLLVRLDEIFGSSSPGVWIYVAMVALFIATPCFIIGFLTLGYAVWLFLESRRRTGHVSAAVAGALGATLVGAALLLMGGQNWWACSIALPLAGACGGIVVRNLGYRPRLPPARPS